MSLHNWLAFLLGVFLICGTPGPNMLAVMTSSMRHGFRSSLFTMTGCFIAVLILIGSSVAGVGVILKAYPFLFTVLRYLGAAYLIYLGVQAWRVPVAPWHAEPGTSLAAPKTLFRNGFLIGISNPKALLFAAAFFPQFLEPGAPQALQLVILMLTFAAMEIGWYMAYAVGGGRLAHYMENVRVRYVFQRFTAGLFVFFGVCLALKTA